MFIDIEHLEEAFNAELARSQFPVRPSPGLLAAAQRWSSAVWHAAEVTGPEELTDRETAEGLALMQRPVFVCGVHRSGTTLLRNLLDGHAALAVLPSEGSYLTNLHGQLAALPSDARLPHLGREWLRRLANPNSQQPFWLLGRTSRGRSPYVEFARRLMAWWVVARDAFEATHMLWPLAAVAVSYADARSADAGLARLHYWVDKTPTNELHLDSLRQAFPRARCIHVVRSPLDVIASRKRLEERVFGSFGSFARSVTELSRSLEIALAEQASEDESKSLLVKYEDLVAHRQRETERLLEYLQIEEHSILAQPTVAGRPAAVNSSFAGRSEKGVVVTDAVSTRSADLSRKEKELIVVVSGDPARRLGYDLPAATRVRHLLRTLQFVVCSAVERSRGFLAR